MSRRNRTSGRDVVFDNVYNEHLRGKGFKNNPTNERVDIIERMYMRVLTELAVNRFKWEGLPDTVDPRFLELTLFKQALSVFYFDKDYDRFFALQGSGVGPLNMLNNPTHFLVTGTTFNSKTMKAFNSIIDVPGMNTSQELLCVPIWANYLRVPDLDIVLICANRLAEIDRTIEINTKSARRTKVIVTDENTKLTVANIDRQLDEGQSTIKLSRPIGDEVFTALDLGVNPDSIEKLSILRARHWNDCMTLLGIDNSNQDKKERLVSAEVDANDDQISATRAVALNARKQAARSISTYFGLSVSVDYNNDVEDELSTMVSGFKPEGI